MDLSKFNEQGKNSTNTNIVFAPSVGHRTVGLQKIATRFTNEDVNMDSQKGRHRSQKTTDQYADRVRFLYRQGALSRTSDPQNPVDPSPMDIAQDLVNSIRPGTNGKNPIRSNSSWCLYRSAMLWHLSMNRLKNDVYESAYQLLLSTNMVINDSKKEPKKETFKSGDLSLLINTLGSMDKGSQRWGASTACWLKAGIASGARSSEWVNASWLDRNKCQLYVKTMKVNESRPAYLKLKNVDANVVNSVFDLEQIERATDAKEFNELKDGRDSASIEFSENEIGNSKFRIVRIDSNDSIYVDSHLASIKSHSIEQAKDGVTAELAFAHYCDMVRKTLRKACKIAFKGEKYYSLRVTRSQFSANKKVANILA